jgi:hypothetical protein
MLSCSANISHVSFHPNDDDLFVIIKVALHSELHSHKEVHANPNVSEVRSVVAVCVWLAVAVGE